MYFATTRTIFTLCMHGDSLYLNYIKQPRSRLMKGRFLSDGEKRSKRKIKLNLNKSKAEDVNFLYIILAGKTSMSAPRCARVIHLMMGGGGVCFKIQ